MKVMYDIYHKLYIVPVEGSSVLNNNVPIEYYISHFVISRMINDLE